MVSSMLASPQGASEQYMWIEVSGDSVKGCDSSGVFKIQGEGGKGGVEIRRHWSRRKRLKERMARVSACQSWRMVPWARGSLLEGRHFMPVLGSVSVLEGLNAVKLS
jgi:hypothetical protein